MTALSYPPQTRGDDNAPRAEPSCTRLAQLCQSLPRRGCRKSPREVPCLGPAAACAEQGARRTVGHAGLGRAAAPCYRLGLGRWQARDALQQLLPGLQEWLEAARGGQDRWQSCVGAAQS